MPTLSTTSATSAPASLAARSSPAAAPDSIAHAASLSMMAENLGTWPTGPMVARVGLLAEDFGGRRRGYRPRVTASILLDGLGDRDDAAENLPLPGQLLAAAAGGFQAHQQPGFELGAGAVEFGLGDVMLHLASSSSVTGISSAASDSPVPA